VLYSLDAEIIPIGTYIAAGAGKLYNSGAINWGTERVKLIKEIQLEMEAAAAITVKLYTDLPGDVTTERIERSVAITSGRQSAKIRLPNNIKGRQYGLTLASASDFPLYEARAQIKSAGNPGATAWTWVEFPLEKTSSGIWAFASCPVVRTGSNEWRWVGVPMDKVA
jgi:hypothetical protein